MFFVLFFECKQQCILWMQSKQCTLLKYMPFTKIVDDTFFQSYLM